MKQINEYNATGYAIRVREEMWLWVFGILTICCIVLTIAYLKVDALPQAAIFFIGSVMMGIVSLNWWYTLK